MPTTVAELIAALSKYDGELLVAISDMEEQYRGREVLHIYGMGENDAEIAGEIEIPANHL